MDMPRRLGAEFFGTFWLTFAGCGSAVFAAGFPMLGIGFLGVSFAFGLTVLTMAYAVGHISGGHFNCAVTIGSKKIVPPVRILAIDDLRLLRMQDQLAYGQAIGKCAS
jgi:glycerol uptake facilitator-like aquaporin